MKKFQKIGLEWSKLSDSLRAECVAYLKRELKKHSNCINWEEYDCPPCVSYDGGNHPEYASNCFSSVYGVSLNKHGQIILHTEDCDEYPVENISVDELYGVCDFVEGWVSK